ncbi:MAG: ATP-dependent DNA helicase RecG [Candidatus Daviesbacteria bacterium]|nr:MAG: ATP-dependent DNA helicase RecG [Candidatus Daviesbacteria bacterium]
MDLKTPLVKIPGIGLTLSKRLAQLQLFTVEDLIYYFPFRYEDLSTVKTASELQPGEKVTLVGEIWQIKNSYTRTRKVITKALFNDGSHSLELTWFNQSYLPKTLPAGTKLQIAGKVSLYKNNLSIIAPVWERLPTPGVGEVETSGLHGLHTGRLVPIYSEIFGVNSKWFRSQIHKILPQVKNEITEFLPDQIKNGMQSLDEAIEIIHFPKNWEELNQAQERLGFDELFLVQLATLQTRLAWQQKKVVEPWQIDSAQLNKFIHSLPFQLTNSQQKVLGEIISDLKKELPMNRLLQGEVGSGKTVVAVAAAYLAFLNGFQTLLMAPTEILAWQHHETLKKLLEPFGISVGIYTGSRKNLAAGSGDVIIGTHALLSDKLVTKNVGLVIIDEQHRFGVEQRSYLRQKAKVPHFLTMTATPIPRTVALTLYGDLDLSVIDELPKNRPKISTHLVPEKKRSDAYKFIEKKVKAGGQAYIITPMIEPSETNVSAKAAKVEYERLLKIFPHLKLGLLHGRLKAKEKEAVLQDFREGKVQILVSTSVVEVGVDILNATIMVIEGAEKFGLAQLHQLRGRIGRGAKESFCLLFTSGGTSETARLKYLTTTYNGLKLAELDLKIRGSGTIFGIAQSGRWNFQIADLTDLKLIEKTKTAAENLLQIDPQLDNYPNLKAKLSNLAREVMPD